MTANEGCAFAAALGVTVLVGLICLYEAGVDAGVDETQREAVKEGVGVYSVDENKVLRFEWVK